MEKNNMTAVEWLYSHLFPKQLDGFSDEEWGKIDKAFEQAKIMEETHIRMAWTDGHALGKNGLVVVDYSNSREYYNKHYKK